MKTFPCPVCTARGEPSYEPGDCVDVGDDEVGTMMLQISADIPCGCCDGEEFIEVGSEKHFYIKFHTAYKAIQDVFGEDVIFSLPEPKLKKFWGQIENSIKMVKDIWLLENKQES